MPMADPTNTLRTLPNGAVAAFDGNARYTLCEDPPGCCPTVDLVDDHVVITDDDGGHVKLTRAQFRKLGGVALVEVG